MTRADPAPEAPNPGKSGHSAAEDVEIEVLLAARDGADFLPAQLDSILAQSWRRLRILVRDDASADGTPEVIADYARRHPGRVVPVPAGGGERGVLQNFGALLSASKAPLVMLSDQDDVWLADKVAATRARLLELEARHGAGTPLLVHTDLVVVDRHLRTKAGSFWRYQHLDPSKVGLNRLLVQNVVTGCTSMANRALVDLALPLPPEALMHDWWLALVAAAFGRIAHVSTATALYRQHGANALGARRFGPVQMARRLGALVRDPTASLETLRATMAQGRVFRDRYRERLSPANRDLLDDFSALSDLPPGQRRRVALRRSFLKIGLVRNAVWLGYWLPRL